MEKDELLKILESDELGLLELKKKTSSVLTEEDRLLEKFNEIVEFFQLNGREPEYGSDNMEEHTLSCRLKALREDVEKIEVLKPHDGFNLLRTTASIPKTIDEIEDEFGILDDMDSDIFDLKNIPEKSERDNPDYIAQRKPCKDFELFEELFIQCHSDLKKNERKLLDFEKEQEIHVGEFFVLKGVLVFIADKGESFEKNDKINARLRVLYENGTESDLLLRSLSRELYRDGKRVTDNINSTDQYLDHFRGLNEEDESYGFIYILKSKSEDAAVKEIQNLYKIGFSTQAVEDRIRNAEKDPTYLMAPVEIISVYECFNMSSQKFENLIHRFFAKARLNIDVFGGKNKRYSPKEWFIVPLPVIEKAVHALISGAIMNYEYSPELEALIYKT